MFHLGIRHRRECRRHHNSSRTDSPAPWLLVTPRSNTIPFKVWNINFLSRSKGDNTNRLQLESIPRIRSIQHRSRGSDQRTIYIPTEKDPPRSIQCSLKCLEDIVSNKTRLERLRLPLTWTAVVSIAGGVLPLLAQTRPARVLRRRRVTGSLPGLQTLPTAETAPVRPLTPGTIDRDISNNNSHWRGTQHCSNTELTAGGLEDSLLVLSIEVNLHCLIQQVLVKTRELKAQVRPVIDDSQQDKTYFSKGASGEASVVGEAVIAPIALMTNDPAVLEPLHHLPAGVHWDLPGVLREYHLLIQTTARICPLYQSLDD